MSSLTRSATVFLDANGKGTVTIAPHIGEKWRVTTASVRVSSTNAEATCNVYVGDAPSNLNFRGNTFSGSSGDTTDSIGGVVAVPDKIWAVWTGGDPGALATLVITGNTV